MMNYIRSEPISLKKSSEYSEKWVQALLAESPELLGLGEITLREVERRQLNGGRLDLLFDDDAEKTRYAVELQLGATDEAHIIRTIEYWDNERSRNPHIDHVAVIVAEDITTRFLNVISLFNKSVPLIAIQMNAIRVGENITLNFVKILDISVTMGWEDDSTATTATNRDYWLAKASDRTVAMADGILKTVHEIVPNLGLSLNYNKHYIGLASNGMANNFIQMRPRKQNLLLQIRLPRSEETTEQIESQLELISYNSRWGRYQVRLAERDLVESADVIRDLLRKAAQVSEEPGD